MPSPTPLQVLLERRADFRKLVSQKVLERRQIVSLVRLVQRPFSSLRIPFEPSPDRRLLEPCSGGVNELVALRA